MIEVLFDNYSVFFHTDEHIEIGFEYDESDKLKIDTNGRGKEFAKQAFCKLIDEAEEV